MFHGYLRRSFVHFNRFVYRATRGIVGARASGMRHLLLTTTGARTGRSRTQPLTCMVDGDRLYVVGSNWGGDAHPAWWHNLDANPQVRVQLGATERPMRGRTLDGEERAAIWPRLVAYNPRWQAYQDGVSRALPVVELSPV